MTTAIRPTYDNMLPADLETLQVADDRQLVEWYHDLNGSRWPEALSPCEPEWYGSHEAWKAMQPDRRDDIMEWIRNKVGPKYLLMVYQCEQMMRFIPGAPHPSDADFERWWNEPHPGDPSITKGENHLRSAAWWTKAREEWRSVRKARTK